MNNLNENITFSPPYFNRSLLEEENDGLKSVRIFFGTYGIIIFIMIILK